MLFSQLKITLREKSCRIYCLCSTNRSGWLTQAFAMPPKERKTCRSVNMIEVPRGYCFASNLPICAFFFFHIYFQSLFLNLFSAFTKFWIYTNFKAPLMSRRASNFIFFCNSQNFLGYFLRTITNS